MYGSWDPPGARLLDVVAVMDRLRSPGGCPWDAEQTHASLAPYLLEEAYELLDAIEDDDLELLREELGDVLLQVAFHARLAEERAEDDRWSIDDVAGDLVAKLVRRHPHVFADRAVSGAAEVEANWEEIKAAEKRRRSVTDGVPLGQPALALAAKLRRRAAKAGLDGPTRRPGTTSAAGCSRWSARRVAAGVDPEAALRATARGYRAAVRAAEAAGRAGCARAPLTGRAAEPPPRVIGAAAGSARTPSERGGAVLGPTRAASAPAAAVARAVATTVPPRLGAVDVRPEQAATDRAPATSSAPSGAGAGRAPTSTVPDRRRAPPRGQPAGPAPPPDDRARAVELVRDPAGGLPARSCRPTSIVEHALPCRAGRAPSRTRRGRARRGSAPSAPEPTSSRPASSMTSQDLRCSRGGPARSVTGIAAAGPALGEQAPQRRARLSDHRGDQHRDRRSDPEADVGAACAAVWSPAARRGSGRTARSARRPWRSRGHVPRPGRPDDAVRRAGRAGRSARLDPRRSWRQAPDLGTVATGAGGGVARRAPWHPRGARWRTARGARCRPAGAVSGRRRRAGPGRRCQRALTGRTMQPPR